MSMGENAIRAYVDGWVSAMSFQPQYYPIEVDRLRARLAAVEASEARLAEFVQRFLDYESLGQLIPTKDARKVLEMRSK